MTNQPLKVFFHSLNQTFTLDPLYDPLAQSLQMYWIDDDEEKERWYAATGFPTCIMMRRGNQMFVHSALEVKIGEIVG